MIHTFQGMTPEIAEGVFVADSADVIGDVKIGKGSSVWFGAVIRGDSASITIGERTSVQDNATLHCDDPLTIGNNVTIGHNAIVHCRSVGNFTMIGMGARVLAGAVVGSNCVIGAGAVVKENAVVPDNTLMVGIPAKAIRTLEPGCVESMDLHNHYEELAGKYDGK